MKRLLVAVALMLALSAVHGEAAKKKHVIEPAVPECPLKGAFLDATKEIAPGAKVYEVKGPELKAFVDAMNATPPQSDLRADDMMVLDRGGDSKVVTLIMDGCRSMVIEFDRDKFTEWLNTAGI